MSAKTCSTLERTFDKCLLRIFESSESDWFRSASYFLILLDSFQNLLTLEVF
ncbi:hypothetical protein LEP1GSC036_4610 [Leptospira weilii str. 2006001853]|uniref:Uncharacterized protein n=1 Tax=Leptospira weilii str. 2006001853 TaxID=1001589 RepID=A0A828Z131_9LEPT|nr:hypothetical protein LEP1GSC036_4610 [Leptospira weilii str. 2006001853]EMN44192.1 hypothetical protein LEP1GSC086_2920 [Leptospira weilii str. LNT 1234]